MNKQPLFVIDTRAYDKAALYPLLPGARIGRGYSARPTGVTPRSIVIYSTNGRPGSSFSAEARYLRDSPDVSSHYLIGHDGEIAKLLDPGLHSAWHAGVALAGFVNAKSIGIECHHSIGELWPAAQRLALTWLVRDLMTQFKISHGWIDTHRAVAMPEGRKVDPSDWSDIEFYRWRETLERYDPTG